MKTLLLAALACAGMTVAHAQNFTANLTPGQDGGGLRQGSGNVNITLSGTTLSLSGSFSGITDGMVGGHIHGPAPIGSPAGVIYNLITLGNLSGAGTTSGTFSGNLNLIANPPGYTTTAQQLAD